jgi:hypothetical protein
MVLKNRVFLYLFDGLVLFFFFFWLFVMVFLNIRG